MSEPNKHHYIPIFYSKQWAGANGNLCEFSRPYKTVAFKWKNPAATGYETGLYTMPGVPVDQAQKLEKLFMGMTDESAAKALKIFLEQTPTAFSSAERVGWARFLYAMTHRNPEKIASMRDKLAVDAPAAIEEYRAAYDSIRQPTDPATFDEFKAKFLSSERNMSPLNVIPFLLQSQRVLSHIAGMNFRTLRLKQFTGRTFLTSDRPVIMTNGLLKPDSHIVIPLSPLALFVADNTDAGYRFLKSLPTEKLVRTINEKVTEQSYRYVYGADTSQLAFVSKRLGKKEPSVPGDAS